MGALDILGAVFASSGVVGGAVYWLLRNERRISTLEAEIRTNKLSIDGLITQSNRFEESTRDFATFVRTRLAVVEQRLKNSMR